MAGEYTRFMCSLCMTNSINLKFCTHFMDSISTMYYKPISIHYLLIYKFFKDIENKKTRKRIDDLNNAKSKFMISLNICDDIKKHIYSFM